MSSQEGAWEGLGGPVNLNRPNFDDLDPTLSACCRREVESNRQRSALEETLRRHDVAAQAERRRRHLIPNLSWGTGCRCCYDPNGDGGEYCGLIEAREKQNLANVEEEQQQKEDDPDDSDDSESEDEFDYLLDEDFPESVDHGGDENSGSVLRDLEQRRREELELAALHQEAALQHGYGAHRQMHPARVLRAAGLGDPGASRTAVPGVVLHLFDPDSSISGELDLYLETLANSHRGTKFLRSNGRATLLMDAEFAQKFLPRLRPDKDMPALVAIRDGVVVATSPQLQGLVDRASGLETLAVKDWLDHTGILITQPPPVEELCRIRQEELALYDYLQETNAEKRPPQEERYDCGMPECNKTFPHDHVGVKTEKQDGLVVQEEDVVI